LRQIEASKNQGLERLLYGIGVRHVGGTVAESLAAKFKSMEQLMSASEADLMKVDGIGEIIAASIADFFSEPTNKQLVRDLVAKGLSTTAVAKASGPLEGKSFVFTGAMKKYSRSEAGRKVEALGGKVGSSLTKKTDFLVVGEDPGSKLDEAKKLGVKVIEEAEFLEKIGDTQ